MKVRVPATIANLGPGFDVMAMAVELWLEAEATPAAQPGWTFEGAQPGPGHPFEALAMVGTVASSIPLGVGLGSSAAARVAALRLAGHTGDDLYAGAVAAEGHPDNVAAAIRGGVVLISGEAVLNLPVPDLDVALFVAREPVPTERARAILPASVPLGVAAANGGRVALLVHALHTGRWNLLETAMHDELHQPARAALYPWLPATISAAVAAGAHGAALAGAGPTVFAFCPRGSGATVAAAMTAAATVPGRPLVTGVAQP